MRAVTVYQNYLLVPIGQPRPKPNRAHEYRREKEICRFFSSVRMEGITPWHTRYVRVHYLLVDPQRPHGSYCQAYHDNDVYYITTMLGKGAMQIALVEE